MKDELVIDEHRRIEIPEEIDEESKFVPGQRVRLRRLPNGDLVLGLVRDFLDLYGCMKYDGPPISDTEIKKAIEEEVVSEYLRSIQTS